jgi:predicted MFS family arabinose efflux permease
MRVAAALTARYVAGALIAGVLADRLGVRAAIGVVAALTALSGLVAARHLPGYRPATCKGAQRPARVPA